MDYDAGGDEADGVVRGVGLMVTMLTIIRMVMVMMTPPIVMSDDAGCCHDAAE